MKSLIFYGSRVKLTNAHKPVHHHGGPMAKGAEKQPEYFVRIKVYRGDCCKALDQAKPAVGEIVLNTVEIE
jgi:hypothetical protein